MTHSDAKSVPRLIFFLLLINQFIHGAHIVLVKLFVQDAGIDPVVLLLLRDTISAPMLLAAGIYFEGVQWPTRKELPLLFVLGLTGVYCNQMGYFFGLYLTSPTNVAILQPLTPVLTTIVAIIARVEPVPQISQKHGAIKIAGILFAALGAVLMIFTAEPHDDDDDDEDDDDDDDDDDHSSTDLIFGNLLLVGNCLAFSTYLVLQKKYVFGPHSTFQRWKSHSISLTAWAYVFAAMLLVCTSMYNVAYDPDSFHFGTEIIPALLENVILASVIAYALTTYCNSRAPTTLVASFWPLQVVIGVTLSWIIFDHGMTNWQFVGAAGIIMGLTAVTYSNSIAPPHAHLVSGQTGYKPLADNAADIDDMDSMPRASLDSLTEPMI